MVTDTNTLACRLEGGVGGQVGSLLVHAHKVRWRSSPKRVMHCYFIV